MKKWDDLAPKFLPPKEWFFVLKSIPLLVHQIDIVILALDPPHTLDWHMTPFESNKVYERKKEVFLHFL